MKRFVLLTSVFLLSGTPVCASSLTGFFTQMSSSDPDIGVASGVIQGLVQNQLGPNGLPVLSSVGFANGLGNPADINSTTNELLWWSPGADPHVSSDSNPVQIDSLPIVHTSNYFPTGQSNNSTLHRTVHWSGSFNLASSGSITLGLGSDDDAWVFIDSQLAIDDGGIHGFSFVPNTITNLSAGNHTIDIFFADREPVQSGIEVTSDITLNPTTTPEPASLTLLGIGLTGMAVFGYRRKRKLG